MEQLVELPPGACKPLEGRMGPEVAVLPVPAITQGLLLRHAGEQLGVQELILVPDAERFSKRFYHGEPGSM